VRYYSVSKKGKDIQSTMKLPEKQTPVVFVYKERNLTDY